MTIARHTYSPREVGFFVEAALSPLSVSSVEWSDNGGVVEIYTTPDPLHTLRDINNWTKFSKPGSSGSFDAPAGTRKIAIGATSHDANDPSLVTIISDGLTNMEQARIYGVDQLAIPTPAAPAPLPGTPFAHFDLSDLSTLFQTAGTGSPVTTHGQTIHHIVDKQANMSDLDPNFGSSRVWDSAFGGIGGGDLTASNWRSASVPSMSNGEWTILVVFEMQSDVNGGWWAYAGTPNLANFTAGDDLVFATNSGDLVWDGVGEDTPYSTLLGLIMQADASSLLGYRSDLSGSKLPDAAWTFEELDGVGAMGLGPLVGSMTCGELILWDSQPTIPDIKDYAGDKWSFAWA